MFMAGTAVAVGQRTFAQTKPALAVYKDPSCGCCQSWVQHMAANGFAPAVTDTADMTAIKTRYKVPAALQSCHTAVVGSYVIEGHVPAADVKRLLAAKPKGIVGLTVPGMPASAPGMDGKPFQPYTVLTFDAAGATTPFARHDRA
jgi:hypothetical protein